MASKPNNILVICSDHHHPLMSGYRGHPFVKTPNLDALAARGACFTRAYCNSPLCTPSRMSFITGKYVHQIDSWAIGVPLDPAEMTWARRLDQAGIESTMLGKMDFCGDYQDGGFTHHEILRRRGAWEEYPKKSPWEARLKDYTRADIGRHLRNAGTRTGEIISDGDLPDEGNDEVGNYDHDRIITNRTLEFLREKGGESSDRPWALYVGLLLPHWAYRVPEEYFSLYDRPDLPLPPNARFPNEDLHPAMRHLQSAFDRGEATDEMLRKVTAVLCGMVTCMDAMVGEILRELSAQGLAETTTVIYTTDHGDSIGEHGLINKQCSYEGSVGVPLIVAGPDLPPGRRIDHPVTLVDMYPTIMDLADLTAEPDRPGRSWIPLILGDSPDRPDYAFSEFHGNFLRHTWYMLVRGKYKYTYYVNERASLFDVERDPREDHDLALDPQYAPVLEEFERVLRTVIDPEEVSLRAKRDLGLIGPDGEDYTETLSVRDLPND